MSVAIILDWTMAIMLIVSITYSFRLNKKIIDFKNSKGEFFQIIKILDETIVRAENNIEELKKLSVKTSRELGVKLDEAKILSNDLAFMTDRASGLGNKLEEFIKNAKYYDNLNKYYYNQKPNSNNNSDYDYGHNLQNHNEPINKDEAEPKKAAIESLLAKISAVKNRKETVNS